MVKYDVNIKYKHSPYYLAGFINACIMACLIPVMSLYAYQYLGASSAQLSVLLGGYSLSSILYAIVIARIVERLDRHKIWLLGISLMASCALILLSNTQNYLFAVFIMSILFAPFHTSTSLLMGLAFRYFPREQITRVNARLMATISAAWIVGPSLAFYMTEHLGFNVFFYALGVVLVLLALLFYCLPISDNTIAKFSNSSDEQHVQTCDANPSDPVILTTKKANDITDYAFLWPPIMLFTLLSFAINLYQHLMPVYFVKEGLSVSLVGILFMSAAIVEISLITRCPSLLSRFSYHQLFIIASVCGIAFFMLLPLSQNTSYLFLLQTLKAIMYGIMAGLGVNLLQRLLPNESTFAVALYQNTFAMGMLLAGFAVGAAVQYLPPQGLFSISAAVALLCLIILLLFRRAFTVAAHADDIKD
ncbi:MFS transporter [Paraglaciecola sp. 20A4]|uniref:MFS transporter n=1 Tax=Paraglaciecola sp. 20A4 TaxID=2687288 RepID=UPI003211D2F5